MSDAEDGGAKRAAAQITLTAAEKGKLDKRATARSVPVRLRERARILLLAARGMTNTAIAAEPGAHRNTAARWRSRAAREGVACIARERPRGGNHGGKDSRKQALDRTRPGLPVSKGRGQTMTRDCKRHGTATLCAALNAAAGEVIGRTCRRHRHQEVLKFLQEVERTVPQGQEIHIVPDNCAAHRHDNVLKRIERQGRVFLHFPPASSSWASLVERFFALLTQKRLRRGVFTSLPDLERCLQTCLRACNENPRPLVWTRPVEEILEKVQRARTALPAST